MSYRFHIRTAKHFNMDILNEKVIKKEYMKTTDLDFVGI